MSASPRPSNVYNRSESGFVAKVLYAEGVVITGGTEVQENYHGLLLQQLKEFCTVYVSNLIDRLLASHGLRRSSDR